MVARSESTTLPDIGIYIDSSALAKLYLPERESEALDALLRGRRDLLISDLAVTEVISAVARRRREGALDARTANRVREALLSDARSGPVRQLDLTPLVHREAEQILLSAHGVPLRTLDALHIALARSAQAGGIITFDNRMAETAAIHGLRVIMP